MYNVRFSLLILVDKMDSPSETLVITTYARE